MKAIEDILNRSSERAEAQDSGIQKHLELEYDMGTLLAVDNNTLDSNLLRRDKNVYFLNLATENTQLLLNEVWSLEAETVDEVLVVKLPKQRTVLPRSKPLPKPRPPTKWELFAKEKGISKKNKTKVSWDEQLQKWIPKYGFKRAKAQQEKEWVLEVPQNRNVMEDQFSRKVGLRNENVAKNELQRLRNVAKARKVKVPRTGVVSTDVSSSKDLQTAITVAKASTASLGKFQRKLPKEKDARGISVITPGVSRKRKLSAISGAPEKEHNLNIVDSVLNNKKVKLNVEQAVAKQVTVSRVQEKNVNSSLRPKSDKKNNVRSKSGKKPKNSKGQRMNKKGGRKRR